jgi:hypothetical protein
MGRGHVAAGPRNNATRREFPAGDVHLVEARGICNSYSSARFDLRRGSSRRIDAFTGA